jgi:cysteine desulfurase / selenocysteine lyase
MPLIAKDQFLCDTTRAYLATAGQGLLPASCEAGARRYFDIRARRSAQSLDDVYDECKEQVATLLGVSADTIAFTGSTSDGINSVYACIDWRPGDNVIIVDEALEFPSVVAPARALEGSGVEVRQVLANRMVGSAQTVSPADVAAAVDSHTRLVIVSHVSYKTGFRFDLAEVSAKVRAAGNAWFAVDASQSLGVVPVDAQACDFVVSTGFKWTLGAHGAAIFFWNKSRTGDCAPPATGWHSFVNENGHRARLKSSAERFEPGNPAYLPISVLNCGLRTLADAGTNNIAHHVESLAGCLFEGATKLGLPVTTPRPAHQRAGIICWSDLDCASTALALADRGIDVTGNAGRIRASVHVYNDAGDVERLLDAMNDLRSGSHV